MRNQRHPKELIEQMYYRKDDLIALYKGFFKDLVEAGHIIVPSSWNTKKYYSLTKQQLTDIVNSFFLDKHTFVRCFNALPEDLRKVLTEIVWHGTATIEYLETKLKVKIIDQKKLEKSRYCYSGEGLVYDRFLLFMIKLEYDYDEKYNNKYNHSIMYLPEEITKILKTFIPVHPENFYIKPSTDQSRAKLSFEGERQTLENIELYKSYIDSKNLEKTKDEANFTKLSIKQMKKYCRINDFYEDKNLDTIRTEMIAKTIDHLSVKTNLAPEKMVQDIAEKLLKADQDFFLLELILTDHLKFKFNWKINGFEDVVSGANKNFIKIIQALPTDKKYNPWISVKNILDYSKFREIDLEIIDLEAGDCVYYNMKGKYSLEKMSMTFYNYDGIVTEPFVKGFFFLLAAFGLMDIKYNMPENTRYKSRKNPYLSIYDGLEFVRLTKLGEYCFGLSKEYKKTFQTNQDDSKIILDNKKLIIKLIGDDKVKRLAIEKIARKKTANSYLVDYSSLFNECKNLEDINKKIEFFKKHITDSIPSHWQNFFDQIKQNVNPLKNIQEEFFLCKIKDDPALLKLLAEDATLSNLFMKVEGRQILVKKHDYQYLKKYLSSKGYFME